MNFMPALWNYLRDIPNRVFFNRPFKITLPDRGKWFQLSFDLKPGSWNCLRSNPNWVFFNRVYTFKFPKRGKWISVELWDNGSSLKMFTGELRTNIVAGLGIFPTVISSVARYSEKKSFPKKKLDFFKSINILEGNTELRCIL